MYSSLSEVSRQEMTVFLHQCHSRDFGKALLNETDHRSMGIDPMVVLGKRICHDAICAAKPGKSGRILAAEADELELRIEKGA